LKEQQQFNMWPNTALHQTPSTWRKFVMANA